MRRRTAALVVIIIVASGILASQYPQLVRPKEVMGSWRETRSTIYSPDGEKVEGYWMFSLSVNTRHEITFTISDLSKDLRADLSKDIPPGSEIRSGAEISAIFDPAGPPYISGPVTKMGYAYSEGGFESGMLWPKHRIWQFYALGHPEWHVDGRHAPYRITVKKNGGVLFGPKTFVSGIRSGWDDGRKISLCLGMEVRQFAQLTNGLVIPTEKYAYTWISRGEEVWNELKFLGDLKDRLRAGYRNTSTPLLFPDTINKWDEVSSGANITRGGDWKPTPDALTSYPGILGEILEPAEGTPPGVKRFTEGCPSLYHEFVPRDKETEWGTQPVDTFVESTTDMTAIRSLPKSSVSAVLLLKVPSDVFDSWVYRPPYGIPVIVDKYAPEAVDGKRNLISIDVMNEGPTGDVFLASLNYPEVVIDRGPGRVYIPAGETKTLQWTVSRPTTERESYELRWSVEVEAVESGRTATDSGTQTWMGGAKKPPQGFGGIVGKVVDPRGRPIQNAVASAGGRIAFTRANGTFNISNIASGDQELSVKAEGFESFTSDVRVSPNEVTNVGEIILYEVKPKPPIPWVLIAVVISVVTIVGVVLYWLRRRAIK